MTATRRTLIAGNWKMNGKSADGVALATAVAEKMKSGGSVPFDMLVSPPFTLISKVYDAIKGSGVLLGGQDCHTGVSGANTGDISAEMLKDLGCDAVIVGHSERRTDHNESSELVAAKASAAHGAGLIAIICIGETEAERDAGKTLDVNGAQVAGSVPAGSTAKNTVIAYEPVWAIGTGRTPTNDEVQEVHAFIRAELAKKVGADEAGAMRILYGGSMKPGNAKDLIALKDVDGGLIGGASLNADDFWAIGEASK
ncbi:MAG: triose-phosphate isomerase [Rhodospirillaceae bacterium]|nr:triose-phosphate isomerase [Rhodospirillaceae bacterium]